MKWIGIAVVGLIAIVALVALIGSLLPKTHVASRRALFRQPPETLWSVITDFAGAPTWRTDVKKVEKLPDRDGHEVWQEIDKHGQRLPLETLESTPPRRLVRKITDPNLPFGGAWTIEISPADGGSEVTITENGEVYNPIFRFVSRFVMGHAATIESYLKALGNKFGENVR